MTKLKLTLDLSPTCGLTVSDSSGFYDATTNVNGFLPETDSSSPVIDTYKISNGYFFNIVLYNVYNKQPLFLNPGEPIVSSLGTDSTYANNFTPTRYDLSKDGSYTVKRFFLISDLYYAAHASDGLFGDKDIYYTDGLSIYQVVAGVANVISFADFLTVDFTAFTGLVTSSSFVSTCYINSCYSKMMQLILEQGDACDIANSPLILVRDYLYMTLEVIKYLKEFNNITQIQKLLESSDLCGTLCTSVANVTSSNCGCNG